MASRKRDQADDFGGQYAAGSIDLTELNTRIAEAGAAATTAEARADRTGLAPVTTTDVAPS